MNKLEIRGLEHLQDLPGVLSHIAVVVENCLGDITPDEVLGVSDECDLFLTETESKMLTELIHGIELWVVDQ